MNQKIALLNYLKTHKTGITIWVAVAELGITCPHKRCAELESDGHKIIRTWIHGTNRYGNPVRIRKYKLA